MAIRTSYVPSEIYGVRRPLYRVEGDRWDRSFWHRDQAEQREAELAEQRADQAETKEQH